MEYKTFEHILLKLQLASKKNTEFYKLGLDITEITDDLHHIITTVLRAHYGVAGEDMINWWLYEDVDKYLYKKEKIVNDLTLMIDLWKYVEKLRKSKDFIPYMIPEPLTSKQKQAIIEDFFNATKNK